MGLFTAAGSNPDRPASYTNFGQSAIGLAAPGGDFVLRGNAPCTVAVIPRGDDHQGPAGVRTWS